MTMEHPNERTGIGWSPRGIKPDEQSGHGLVDADTKLSHPRSPTHCAEKARHYSPQASAFPVLIFGTLVAFIVGSSLNAGNWHGRRIIAAGDKPLNRNPELLPPPP